MTTYDTIKKLIRNTIKEEGETPANITGAGHVAGLGVGSQGEPGKKNILTKLFKRKTLPNTN